MEFKNFKCPVCNKQFKSGDDVVVCPECGAPHHRECYEASGKCFYEDKHSEDFSFEENYETSRDDSSGSGTADGEPIICPKCKKENPPASFYCNSCGFPLDGQEQNSYSGGNQSSQNSQNIPPFGFGTAGMPIFDPLAGMKSDEKLCEDITAGEMAKFVGKNTQYYLTVFKKISTSGTSRFCFSAFILSGIYFLYRKMYAAGAILATLSLGLTVAETFIQLTPEYRNIYYQLLNYVGSANQLTGLTSQFSPQEMMLLYSPLVITLLKFAIMLFCGLRANKMYYNHSIKAVKQIKSQEASVNINNKLEEKGGVNIFLAACLVAAYIIIGYIPMFF